MEDLLGVDEAVLSGIARRPKQDIRPWLLVRERNDSSAVGQTTDDDHQETMRGFEVYRRRHS